MAVGSGLRVSPGHRVQAFKEQNDKMRLLGERLRQAQLETVSVQVRCLPLAVEQRRPHSSSAGRMRCDTQRRKPRRSGTILSQRKSATDAARSIVASTAADRRQEPLHRARSAPPDPPIRLTRSTARTAKCSPTRRPRGRAWRRRCPRAPRRRRGASGSRRSRRVSASRARRRTATGRSARWARRRPRPRRRAARPTARPTGSARLNARAPRRPRVPSCLRCASAPCTASTGTGTTSAACARTYRRYGAVLD